MSQSLSPATPRVDNPIKRKGVRKFEMSSGRVVRVSEGWKGTILGKEEGKHKPAVLISGLLGKVLHLTSWCPLTGNEGVVLLHLSYPKTGALRICRQKKSVGVFFL